MKPHTIDTDPTSLVDALGAEFRSEWHAFRQGLLMERERLDLEAPRSADAPKSPELQGSSGAGPAASRATEPVLEARSGLVATTAGSLLDIEASWPAPGLDELHPGADGRPVRPRQLERLRAPQSRHAELGAGALDLAAALSGGRPPSWIELGDLRSAGEGRLWLDWLEALERQRGFDPTPVRLRLDGPFGPSLREGLTDLYEDRLQGVVLEPEAYLAARLRAGTPPGSADLHDALDELFAIDCAQSPSPLLRVLHGHLPEAARTVSRSGAFDRQSLPAHSGGHDPSGLVLHAALAAGTCDEALFDRAVTSALVSVKQALDGREGPGLSGAELIGRLAFWAVETRPKLQGGTQRLDLAHIERTVRRVAAGTSAPQAGELFAWFATAPDPQPALGQALDLVRRSVA